MVARIDTRLKQILLAEGRSQSWLARTVGVDRTLVNRYVHGIHLPERATQEAIAHALGRTVSDVFPDTERVAA
jgi:transcriptional regulator with XRE-family HTH domain